MLVSVHLEIVLFLTQDECTVCANVPQARKWLWTHPIEHLGDLGHVDSHFSPFGERVLVLQPDRCTACAEHTIGLKIVLDTPDRTTR
jgi:hypothetical protein